MFILLNELPSNGLPIDVFATDFAIHNNRIIFISKYDETHISHTFKY